MTISNDKVVHMHYELKNGKGDVLDSSKGREPMAYIQGKGNIIPGLEKHMSDKKVGDKVQAVVEPAEAYGIHDKEKIIQVGKDQFQGDGGLEIGMQIQANVGGNTEVGTVEKTNSPVKSQISGVTFTDDVQLAQKTIF